MAAGAGAAAEASSQALFRPPRLLRDPLRLARTDGEPALTGVGAAELGAAAGLAPCRSCRAARRLGCSAVRSSEERGG